MGPGPAHGFARNSQFKATSVTQSKAVLELEANEKTHATFPHQFVLTVTVEVSDDNGGTLKQTVCAFLANTT
jgi:galactose mutarotase-like enzyme